MQAFNGVNRGEVIAGSDSVMQYELHVWRWARARFRSEFGGDCRFGYRDMLAVLESCASDSGFYSWGCREIPRHAAFLKTSDSQGHRAQL